VSANCRWSAPTTCRVSNLAKGLSQWVMPHAFGQGDTGWRASMHTWSARIPPYVPPRLANIAHPKVTDVGQAWRILLGCITHPIGPGPSTSKCDSALPNFPRHFPLSGYPRFSKTGDLLKRYVKHRWHFSTSDAHVSAATTPIVQLVTFVPACLRCTFSFWDFGHHMCTCQCL